MGESVCKPYVEAGTAFYFFRRILANCRPSKFLLFESRFSSKMKFLHRRDRHILSFDSNRDQILARLFLGLFGNRVIVAKTSSA